MAIFEAIVLAVTVGVIVAAFLYTRGESRTNMKLVDQFKADGNTVIQSSTTPAVAATKTTPVQK